MLKCSYQEMGFRNKFRAPKRKNKIDYKPEIALLSVLQNCLQILNILSTNLFEVMF